MDIGDWLRSLGLDQYKATFREHDIDAEVLPELTEADLERLGVSLGHRKRLLKAIRALQTEEPARKLAVQPMTPPIPDPSHLAERRQLTVMFCDLVGSTALSAQLDPEDLREVIGAYHQAVAETVRRFDGFVAKYMGDGVLVYFGYPRAHEDDAERAVLAGLDVVAAIEKLAAPTGKLEVRIGIATGLVVVGDLIGEGAAEEHAVVGETPNLAARLQALAQPGTIIVPASTRSLLGNLFKLRDLGRHELKGFVESVEAWAVEGVSIVESRFELMRSARLSGFVGRQSELQQFRAVLAITIQTGRGQVIYIRGEAGIGKTRLLAEFQRIASDSGFACHSGLVLDFGTRTGRDAIRSLAQSLVGIDYLDEPPASPLIEQFGQETDAVFLKDLIGIPQSADERALYEAMDHATRREGRRKVTGRLLIRASELKPRLLAVEDLHWADQVTLADLAALAATAGDCPAILVMTSRTEGNPVDHAWRMAAGAAPFATIDLGPLRPADAQLLAAHLLSAADDLVSHCIKRAGGNPLFLEQLLLHAKPADTTAVPGSVHSLVQARLDRLFKADKVVVQTASVLGQLFDRAALNHLLGETDTQEALLRLSSNLLIRPQGDQFLFHHALIRDAIYDELLKSRRRELHRRAADWYAGHDLSLHAEHLDRAQDPSAAQAYAEAVRSEIAAYHFDAALKLATRGLAIATTPADRFALECLHGDISYELGDTLAARGAYERALSTASSQPERCRAFIGLATVKRVIDDLDGAATELDQATIIAQQAGLVLEQARIHYLRGNLCFPRGDVEGCIREHSRSLALARQAGAAELEAQALGGLGDGEYMRGRMITAYRAFSECLVLCEQHGFGRIEVVNRPMLAHTAFFVGGPREALEKALDSIAAAAKAGHQRAQIISYGAAFFAFHHLAEWEKASKNLEPLVVLAQQLGARRFEAQALAFRAELHRIAGRREKALADIEAALAISRKTGMAFLGPFMLGILAHTTDDPAVFDAALSEGDALLAAGAVAHNHYLFHRDAIDACLERKLWDRALSHAARLETFAAPEPEPLTRFVVARARLLAAIGRGAINPDTITALRQLRDEAETLGFRYALHAIDTALASLTAPSATLPLRFACALPRSDTN